MIMQASPAGMAMATSAVLAALLERLIQRRVLSQVAVRDVIATAQGRINVEHRSHIAWNDAANILTDLLRAFPDPYGDV